MPRGREDRELPQIVARLMVERLDRSRPLWSIRLVGPLPDGSQALVWRIHHCLADGFAAMKLRRDHRQPRRPLGGGRQPGARIGRDRTSVGLHRPGEADGVANRDLFMFVDLDVAESDPVARLRAISRRTSRASAATLRRAPATVGSTSCG